MAPAHQEQRLATHKKVLWKLDSKDSLDRIQRPDRMRQLTILGQTSDARKTNSYLPVGAAGSFLMSSFL